MLYLFVKVQSLLKNLECKEGLWDEEKSRLQKYIEQARDNLGLEIMPTNTLKSFIVAFKNLDKRDTDRKFLAEIELVSNSEEKNAKQSYSGKSEKP